MQNPSQASLLYIQSANEELFRLLVDSVKDYAIYVLNPDGIIVSWNPGAERIKGYKAQNIIGKHFSCFYTENDIRQNKPMLELQQAAQAGRFESEGQRVRQDGSVFWVNAVVNALYSTDGDLCGFAKVTRDITERKEAEAVLQQTLNALESRVEERTAALSTANQWLREEIAERQQIEHALRRSQAELKQQTLELQQALKSLKETQAQLVQAEKMSSLGRLVAGIAHEINNPLNFISGNLEFVNLYIQSLMDLLQLYQSHYPNPVPQIQEELEEVNLEFLKSDLAKLLPSMKSGTDRIRQIVLSLRNFSRLDEATYKRVDLHEGLENTLLLLQHRLQANTKRPAIQINRVYGTLPEIECHASQINQVFINILTNAIDALDQVEAWPALQTPSLTIETTIIQNTLQIRIADNGPGIPDAVKSHLFDPFFTTKPVGQGTGMGLAIAYQIIANHQGRIECSSSPKGAEFKILLPLSRLNFS